MLSLSETKETRCLTEGKKRRRIVEGVVLSRRRLSTEYIGSIGELKLKPGDNCKTDKEEKSGSPGQAKASKSGKTKGMKLR